MLEKEVQEKDLALEQMKTQLQSITKEAEKEFAIVTVNALTNKVAFTGDLLTSDVEVSLGNDETKSKIESQGVILPILLMETIKGFMELFISHGLPKNVNDAITVIGRSDFIKAEVLALEIVTGSANADAKEWNINGEKVTLSVEKI